MPKTSGEVLVIVKQRCHSFDKVSLRLNLRHFLQNSELLNCGREMIKCIWRELNDYRHSNTISVTEWSVRSLVKNALWQVTCTQKYIDSPFVAEFLDEFAFSRVLISAINLRCRWLLPILHIGKTPAITTPGCLFWSIDFRQILITKVNKSVPIYLATVYYCRQ